MAKPDIELVAADLERTRKLRQGRAVSDGLSPDDAAAVRGLVSDGAQLRILIEAVEDYAIILLDASGRVASWNEGARRIKGYEAAEVMGRHFALFYPLDDIKRGKAQEELASARESGRFEEDGWRVRKGGERYLAHVVLTAVRDPGGALRGFVKVTRDLSDRERARSATEHLARTESLLDAAHFARTGAEAAERRLLALLSTMSDGYFTLDEEWRFATVNPSLPRLLGKPEEALVGRVFWDEVTDSVHSNFFKQLPRLLTGTPQVEFVERHEATGRWFAVRAHQADGRIAVYIRDVSSEHA